MFWMTRSRLAMGRAFKAADCSDALIDYLTRITGKADYGPQDARKAAIWIKKNGFSPATGAGFMLAFSCTLLQDLIDANHPNRKQMQEAMPSLRAACLYALSQCGIENAEDVLEKIISHTSKYDGYDFVAVTRDCLAA